MLEVIFRCCRESCLSVKAFFFYLSLFRVAHHGESTPVITCLSHGWWRVFAPISHVLYQIGERGSKERTRSESFKIRLLDDFFLHLNRKLLDSSTSTSRSSPLSSSLLFFLSSISPFHHSLPRFIFFPFISSSSPSSLRLLLPLFVFSFLVSSSSPSSLHLLLPLFIFFSFLSSSFPSSFHLLLLPLLIFFSFLF